MTPILFLLLTLLLLPLLFLMGRKMYGSQATRTATGPKGGDGEGESGPRDPGPG